MSNNQPILITGGSGKLGKIIIKNLLSEGKVVITTCKSEASFKKLKSEFSYYSSNLKIYKFNLLKKTACYELIENLKSDDSLPSVLINNARSLSFLKTDAKGYSRKVDFLNEYHMDVFVPYELSFLLANLEKSPLNKIINIGSQYGLIASNPNLYNDKKVGLPIQYSLAKAALHHLTKELAVRFSDLKISVNCVAYGGVSGRTDDNFKKRYSKLLPIKRMLNETEVPGAINFLISEESSGITGHILVVDGGWSIW